MAGEKKNRSIGQKLQSLRRKRNISLEDLSEKTGLHLDYLARIEEGNELPPVGDILKISRILTVDPGDLLSSEGEDPKTLKKKRIDNFALRESSYFYKVLTPAARSSHMRAFRVTIPPKSEHPKINYQHEGEEFIYVLAGQVDVTVGQKKHRLKKDDSLHFDSGIRHSLKNNGLKETVLIVTLYTP